MNATQQQVQMAAKLYECRDTAKRLFGDGYSAHLCASACNAVLGLAE